MLPLLMGIAMAAESAVLVNFSAGAELWPSGAASASAVTAPYALTPTDRLVLHNGAWAVVFVDGHMVNLTAVGSYTRAGLSAPADGGSVSPGVLARIESARATEGMVAASRGDGAPLVPLPNAVTDRFRGVRWQCTGEPQQLSLVNAAGALVWSAVGCGAVAYRGRALPAGEYRLTIGAVATGFAVGGVEVRREVARMLRFAHGSDVGLRGDDRDAADGMWLCAAGWPGAAASRIGEIEGLQADELLLALPSMCIAGGAP